MKNEGDRRIPMGEPAYKRVHLLRLTLPPGRHWSGVLGGGSGVKSEMVSSLLARSDLFSDLDQDTLLRIAERMVQRRYKKGQVLFFQGDPADSLFIVAEGVVKVMVSSPDGEEMVLTTLTPPEIFGELAVFDGGPRSASAEALEPTTVWGLTRETFLELLRDHPSLEDALMRSLGKVLRRLTEQASDLVFLDLHGRVAKLLLGMAEDKGKRDGDVIVLDLHLTQADLASMVGGSRQRVNMILRHFEDRGFISLDGRRILILRREGLEKRAGI